MGDGMIATVFRLQ